jgi:glycosyltransferase involved in cell wall biosynthesis
VSAAFRPCAVVPVYDNPATVRAVVEGLRRHLDLVVVVDDGSDRETAAVLDDLSAGRRAVLLRRHRNGGKGAAVQDGLRVAVGLGATHALQVDADGQHDLGDVPRLLEAARAHPDALVLGEPVFDTSAPRSRRVARGISKLWVDLETGRHVVRDPLCGFRVYPLPAALRARPRARRMGHDPEIAVRLFWLGADIVNVPTRVRYLTPAEGGVSHYRLVRDNLEMWWVHALLFNQAAPRLAARWLRRRLRGPA